LRMARFHGLLDDATILLLPTSSQELPRGHVDTWTVGPHPPLP
jgi:hypothetical protein